MVLNTKIVVRKQWKYYLCNMYDHIKFYVSMNKVGTCLYTLEMESYLPCDDTHKLLASFKLLNKSEASAYSTTRKITIIMPVN